MDKLAKLIEATPDVKLKTGVTTNDISSCESELGFKFDKYYREYVLKYGKISYKSFELAGLGVPPTSFLHVVKATKQLASFHKNVPAESVMLEDIGEGAVVIYKMNLGVFQFSQYTEKKLCESLEEYILLRFSEE